MRNNDDKDDKHVILSAWADSHKNTCNINLQHIMQRVFEQQWHSMRAKIIDNDNKGNNNNNK